MSDGEKFALLGLNFYPKETVLAILNSLDSPVFFDFAFMAGIYPGITSLCMMARENLVSPLVRQILLVLAWFQLLAWGFDIIENYYLLSWIQKPQIGNEFGLYHFIVGAKWIVALAGFVFAIPLVLRRKNG